MKYLLFTLTTVLTAFISSETNAQSVPDTIGVFENIKAEKRTEFTSNAADEGTNDPTSVGMTLEYWGTQEVYRKTTSVNGLHVVLIFIPKED